MDKHRIIQQLCNKADSTAFPEEADALRARADKLEAKYGAPKPSALKPPWFVPWSNGQPTHINIQDLDEMIRNMRNVSRPMQGGVLIINGRVVGNIMNFTQTNSNETVHIHFEQGAKGE